jgi:hypothetical protein
MKTYTFFCANIFSVNSTNVYRSQKKMFRIKVVENFETPIFYSIHIPKGLAVLQIDKQNKYF